MTRTIIVWSPADLIAGGPVDSKQPQDDDMPGDENESEERDHAASDQPDVIEAVETVEVEIVEVDDVGREPRDPLSVAIVVGLAALLLVCVIFIFIANGHRPAGT